jgi:hypothetical protein
MTASSFRMIVRTGPNPGTTYDLTKEVTLMGRDVSNDIILGDSEISRQHARLTRTPGGYVIEDLGSTNGSFVNGERLMAPRVLNPGDLVALGENVSLTFDAVAPEAAATVASTAAPSCRASNSCSQCRPSSRGKETPFSMAPRRGWLFRDDPGLWRGHLVHGCFLSRDPLCPPALAGLLLKISILYEPSRGWSGTIPF